MPDEVPGERGRRLGDQEPGLPKLHPRIVREKAARLATGHADDWLHAAMTCCAEGAWRTLKALMVPAEASEWYAKRARAGRPTVC